MQGSLNTFAPTSQDASADFQIPQLEKGSKVCIVGAGAFGGWAALFLLRAGYRVTLIDAWGAGNSRSSSGDETRVIRSTYGSNELYFQMNLRALELWKEHNTRFRSPAFTNTGVLWLCHDAHSPVVDDSIPFANKYQVPCERLERSDLRKKYPILFSEDLSHAWFDPFGGYLKARRSCQEVIELFIHEGGNYVEGHGTPGSISSGNMENVIVGSETINADLFLFACGSWLPKVFPFLKEVITCTRQEVYYFGVPSTHNKIFNNFPVWVDLDHRDNYYGIPGNEARGFKVGVDRRGQVFDPTFDDRIIDPDVLQHARTFLLNRFPALQDAPLLEGRVCPYESTADGNFIFDLHPEASNTLILGGGSGHGFKHGPALGELVANCVLGKRLAPALFRLAR